MTPFRLIFVRPATVPVDRFIDVALAVVADLQERGLADALPTDDVPPAVVAALRVALGLPTEADTTTEVA